MHQVVKKCGLCAGDEVKANFYKWLMKISRRAGNWVFVVFAWFVATGYFLFFPFRVAVSVRFYRALFPARSRCYSLWCAWRQYHQFTNVFLDRFLLRAGAEIAQASEGFNYLVESLEKGKGAIVLMSHMGNWEYAANRMKHKGMKVLLYVGKKHKEQIERMQKESLARDGVHIVAADEDGGSPFDIVAGIRFLKEGGVVSMTGDRLWSAEQRSVAVRFLGHEVLLPESPHLFALISGAPIIVFFVFREGGRKYRTIMFPPWDVRASSRPERQEAIRVSAQRYACLLEDMAHRHPFEWYHFEPFLREKPESQTDGAGSSPI
jgi:predicted LPLAT superfamily acyltransferase